MALKQANTLAPANTSATGFALGDARHIGGHRVVASLDALIKLQDWQLLNPGETDTALALGQEWYVKGSGHYRLVSWADRKATSGWRKVVDPNTIDTTLFQIVSALPTAGINRTRSISCSRRDQRTRMSMPNISTPAIRPTTMPRNGRSWERLPSRLSWTQFSVTHPSIQCRTRLSKKG